MGKLSIVAQNVMDLYYQQYKSEEDFFQFSHFLYLTAIGYAAYLQSEYEKSYAKNLAETGTGEATLNSEWFITEEIEIKNSDQVASFYAQLKHPVFQFNFDKQSSGIKDIIALNGRCKDFVRINFDERYKLSLLPPSEEIYWYPLVSKLFFHRIQCGLSKALAIYIPAVSCDNEDAVIPDAMEGIVLASTIDIMQRAKAGTPIVDATSDGNPNKEMLNEINNIINKKRGK